MARVRWHGHEFSAEPIRQNPDGSWIMKAMQHGPRFTVGTEIHVLPSEIMEMASAETPLEPSVYTTDPDGKPALKVLGLGDLQAAMDAERKALPRVQDLLKQGGSIAHDAPDKMARLAPGTVMAEGYTEIGEPQPIGVSVPPNPPQPAQPAPTSESEVMRTPNLDSLDEALAGMVGAVEDAAGALKAKMEKTKETAIGAVEKFGVVVERVHQTGKKLDDAANRMTNGGPPMGNSSGS